MADQRIRACSQFSEFSEEAFPRSVVQCVQPKAAGMEAFTGRAICDDHFVLVEHQVVVGHHAAASDRDAIAIDKGECRGEDFAGRS